MKKSPADSQSKKPSAEELQESQCQQQDEDNGNGSSQASSDRETNDNDNNGMGIARRATQSQPLPQSPSSIRLVNGSSAESITKQKQRQRQRSSSHDDQSTGTGHTGSSTQMSASIVPTRQNQRQTISQALIRSHRNQERLYQRQIQVLATMSGASIVAFLFFFLNIFAFVTLILGLSSTSMLFHTAYSYITYILNSEEGALFHYLPAYIQNYLTNTSFHEAMSTDSNFLENRWYLLYFIPGLTPEQINSMVARLPRRQRDMAHGPGGLARIFLPESVWRLVAPPNGRGQMIGNAYHGGIEDDGRGNGIRSPRLTMTGESGRVMRIMDGQNPEALPVIEEVIEDDNGIDIDALEEEVTVQEAFQGILENARTLIGGGTVGGTVGGLSDVARGQEIISRNRSASVEATGEPFQDMSWDESYDNEIQERSVEVHIVNDSDSETSDLGLEISPEDFTGGMNNSQLSRLGRMLRLRPAVNSVATRSSSPPTQPRSDRPPRTVMAVPRVRIEQSLSDLPNTILMEDDDETLEEDQELEGDIINEAISTMVNNLTTSANNAVSSTITNAAESLVERVTPPMISFGTRVSSMASVGLLGLFASSQMQPSNVFGRSIGGGGRRLGQERAERYLITGLVSTLAMGTLSVGGAYVTRNLMRRHVAANRAQVDRDVNTVKDNGSVI